MVDKALHNRRVKIEQHESYKQMGRKRMLQQDKWILLH